MSPARADDGDAARALGGDSPPEGEDPSGSSRARSPGPSLWALPALVAGVVLAYWPAIQGGFIWDDDSLVTGNPALRSLDGLADLWLTIGTTTQYYPLVFTTFWVEYQLWGETALGYHVTNVVLHAFVSILLGILLQRLGVPGAWWAATVFALHPVHVESVAWITERKNLLSGFFYLLSMLAYDRFAGLSRSETPADRHWGAYALALAAFTGALLSKTVTASLPAAILLLLWWKRKRLAPSDVAPLVPMFAIGVGLGLLTVWMEKAIVGATGAEWSLTLVDRLLVAGRAVWFYLGKLLWPAPLIFIYPRWEIDVTSAAQYVFPLAALTLLFLLWRLRGRIGKGPLVGALYFGGTLFPALGFFDVYPMRFSFVADHFQYLASAGAIAVLVAAFHQILAGAPRVRRAVGLGVLVILASLTWRQARVYEDVEMLWRDTLVKNPTAWIAHNNLGILLAERGEAEEAERAYLEALRHHPDFADAHNNLGTIEAERGRHAQAIARYRRAIEIGPPRAELHVNVALAFLEIDRPREALAEAQEALSLHPGWDAALEVERIARARIELGRAPTAKERRARSHPDRSSRP